MKKIGILTHYYHSTNYGGVLQAYALCRAISNLGGYSEQICYDKNVYVLQHAQKAAVAQAKKKRSPVKRIVNKLKRTVWQMIERKELSKCRGRVKKFDAFRGDAVPHSQNVFTEDNIHEANEGYGVFISGSDQVWNLDDNCPAFFLEFADAGKVKASYAASLGKSTLTAEQLESFRRRLSGFQFVSVREADAVDLLSDYSEVPVQLSLDPTLLLSALDWDRVASDRLVEHPYIFCYFLGADRFLRELVKRFSKTVGLKIVNIPHVTSFIKSDVGFADRSIYDADPSEFISLVKHAAYVFTDSFHCSVFSLQYNKQFFVFPREGKAGMSSRITTLLSMFDAADRFLDNENKATPESMKRLSKEACEYDRKKYNSLLNNSLDYLSTVIGSR